MKNQNIEEQINHETISLTATKFIATSISVHNLSPSEIGHIAFQTANFGDRVNFKSSELEMENGEKTTVLSFKVGTIKLSFFSERYTTEE